VEAASLLSPWTDVAKAVSLKVILRTARSNPTTVVVKEGEDAGVLRRLFLAINEAIDLMNAKPKAFSKLYFSEIVETLLEMPPGIGKKAERLRDKLEVPKWNHWVAYTREDFERTYKWMVERGMAPDGRSYSEVVAENAKQVFDES
jgi:hypothetical protein